MSLYVSGKGLYIQCDEFLVEREGIFVLKAGSEEDPASFIPKVEKLSQRVYYYHDPG